VTVAAAEWAKWAELGFRVGKWAIDTIAAFIGGDTSEPVARLIEILPPSLKSDVEHARQYELTRKALEGDLASPDA